MASPLISYPPYASSMTRTAAWLMEQHMEGRLPLPGAIVQGLLNAGVEYQYRFARTLPDLLPEWRGSDGPIADRSEDLMRVHYDKPLALFENFLGPTMKYTMALWERGAKSLEEAQAAMMDDLCAKAGVQDGDAVLDIACGFGSLSAHILQRYPHSEVVALNLSRTQVDYIQAQQSEPGHPFHTERFRVIREDFAKADLNQRFDRVFVIGLFEHIHNLRAALERISQYLAPDGTVLIHFIAYNRVIRALGDPESDVFLGRHIFPGGRIWNFHELPRYQEHLRTERSWFMNGLNYKRTVEVWHRNFWQNIARIRTHPELDERFLRAWDLYLRLCIAVFGGMGGRNVGNGQYLLRHAGSAAVRPDAAVPSVGAEAPPRA